MSDVQDFIKEKGLQPTRSTLTPYVAEILELRELGFSYRVIAEFLHEKKGLKTRTHKQAKCPPSRKSRHLRINLNAKKVSKNLTGKMRQLTGWFNQQGCYDSYPILLSGVTKSVT